MRQLHAWILMLVAWGYTWLALSGLALLLSWDVAATFSAEGAGVAFGVALVSAMSGLLVAAGRALVERRLQAAGTAFESPRY